MWKNIASIALAGLLLTVSRQATVVPSAFLLEATRDPIVMLMLLAHAKVPAGLEVHVSDQAPRTRPDFQFAREPGVPVEALVTAFNARHGDYRAEMIDGVFVMRPTTRRAPYLDAKSTLGPVEITGVMNAALTVFAGLDPRLGRGGAIAGSYLNWDPKEAGEFTSISLDGRDRKEVDLLNQIVRQSPRGWIVVTSDDSDTPRVLKFGFMGRDGSAIYHEISDRAP